MGRSTRALAREGETEAHTARATWGGQRAEGCSSARGQAALSGGSTPAQIAEHWLAAFAFRCVVAHPYVADLGNALVPRMAPGAKPRQAHCGGSSRGKLTYFIDL